MDGENPLRSYVFTPFELPLKKCAVFLALKEFEVHTHRCMNKGGTACDRRPLR